MTRFHPIQICQFLISGTPVTSPLTAVDKIYPATGEIIAIIEQAINKMLDADNEAKSVHIALRPHKPVAIRACSDHMRQYFKLLAAKKTALQLFGLYGGIEIFLQAGLRIDHHLLDFIARLHHR